MKKDKTVKKGKNVALNSTQAHIKISEIHDDTVILKDGGIRTVLKVSSINFNLKSEDEQKAIIVSYQNFLNSLEFPIQILVRSRKLDVQKYLDNVRDLAHKQPNSLLQNQTYEYADYIAKLIEYADIMEKEFYVIIPRDPYRAEKKGIISQFMANISPKDTITEVKRRHKEFEDLKKGLSQRVNTVVTGLENCGLKVEVLDTQKLIRLFYKSYNPTTSRNVRFGNLDDYDIGNIETA